MYNEEEKLEIGRELKENLEDTREIRRDYLPDFCVVVTCNKLTVKDLEFIVNFIKIKRGINIILYGGESEEIEVVISFI